MPQSALLTCRARKFSKCFFILTLLFSHWAYANKDLTTPITYKETPWYNGDTISHNTTQLLSAIRDASVHGLDPAAYYLQDIQNTVDLLARIERNAYLRTNKTTEGKSDHTIYKDKLKGLLDQAFIKLTRDHAQGLVDPDSQPRVFREKIQFSSEEALRDIYLGTLSVEDVFKQVTPSHPQYLQLTQHLRSLLTEFHSDVARKRFNEKALLQGDPSLNFELLFKLIESGDLPENTPLNTVNEKTLKKGIKAFQARHNLKSSGTVDKQTTRWLNQTIVDEIIATVVNLERWRWLPRDLGDEHLFVNIPAFNAKLVKKDAVVFQTSTVVGSREHPTPQFSDNMGYIEVNPTWTVPARITNQQLIPREQREPGYLANRQFIFLKDINNELLEVPESSITVQDLNTKPFPYLLRQSSGPDNALGQLKFMFPNRFAIYLHDTPVRHQFDHTVRAYSNGCVRLANPVGLAHHLLSRQHHQQQSLKDLMLSENTHRLYLKNRLPVHLAYFTRWVDSEETFHRYKDVYLYDLILENALLNTHSLLGTLVKSPDNQIASTQS